MRARDLSLIVAGIPLIAAIAGSAAGAPKASAPPKTSAGAPKTPAAQPKGAASASQPSAQPAAPRPGPRDAAAQAAEKSALADFDAANYGQAARRLKDEIGRCGAKGCSPAVKARLLAALGLVQSAGMRKTGDAQSSFEQAVQSDPQVALPAGAPEESKRMLQDARMKFAPPPPPPTASAPPPVLSAPAPADVPIQPLQTLGDARWTDIGFVRAGDPPPAPSGSAASLGPPLQLRPPSSLSLDEVGIHLRAGFNDYVPINDGETDDVTDLKKAVNLGLSVRPEWRSVTSPVGGWLDFRFGVTPHVSGAMQIPNSNVSNPMHGSLSHVAFGGQGGVDLVPVGYVSAGPLIGYHLDIYVVSLDDDSSLHSETGGGANAFFDHGLDYGGHVKLRTGDKSGRPSILFLDAAMFRRKGRVLTGTYQRVELGFQPVKDFSLLLYYQTRSSASGYAGLKDVQDPADAIGYMMPLERMIGIGIGAVITGPGDGSAGGTAGGSVGGTLGGGTRGRK